MLINLIIFWGQPSRIRSFMHDRMISPPKAKFHSKFFCAFLQIADENGLSIAAPFCITDEAQPVTECGCQKQGTREILQLKMDIVTMIHSEALRTLHSKQTGRANRIRSLCFGDREARADGQAAS